MPVKLADEVKNFNVSGILSKKEMQCNDQYCLYAIHAANHVIDDAGISNADPFSVGVLIGNSVGGIPSFKSEYEKFLTKGNRKFDPACNLN